MKTPLILLALVSICNFTPAAILDFEQVWGDEPFESLTVSNQFAATHGMTFSGLTPVYYPIVVKVGNPGRAFGVTGLEYDSLYPTNAHDHGQFFLSDPGGGLVRGSKGFVIQFAAPVSYFGCHLMDLDTASDPERVTLTAYASDAPSSGLATNVFYSTNAPFGEGLSGFAGITNQAKQIRRIEVKAQGRSGYPLVGFDNFISDFTPVPQSAAQLTLRFYPGITVTGTVGTPYRIDYADNFDLTPASTNWHPLATIHLSTSPFRYFDTSPTNRPSRIYRAVGVQ